MAALECVRRGRRPLLIERGRLGTGATGASLGIIHGGLRYLQSLDVARWRRSRAEQLWFASQFPSHVTSLRCVMPLYRGTIRSRLMFRAAFRAQSAARRLAGLNGEPGGAGLLSAQEVRARFPVPENGLVGAAFWDELSIVDSGALMRALAGRIVAGGGTIIENETVIGLRLRSGQVIGVASRSAETHQPTLHDADLVLNCAGAGAQALAAKFDRAIPQLSCRVLAFNLLLDAPMSGAEALAVSPVPGRGRSLFLRPHPRGTLAGTGYSFLPEGANDVAVPQRWISAFLDDVAQAVPALAGARHLEVWAGRLPDNGRRIPGLRDRDVVWNHGRHNGPKGLVTLTATKLTTAHAHARAVLDRLWPDRVVPERRSVLQRSGDPFGVEWKAE